NDDTIDLAFLQTVNKRAIDAADILPVADDAPDPVGGEDGPPAPEVDASTHKEIAGEQRSQHRGDAAGVRPPPAQHWAVGGELLALEVLKGHFFAVGVRIDDRPRRYRRARLGRSKHANPVRKCVPHYPGVAPVLGRLLWTACRPL